LDHCRRHKSCQFLVSVIGTSNLAGQGIDFTPFTRGIYLF
jgi:hypothetical protein